MEQHALFQVQPCALCGGTTAWKLTELTYDFDRVRIVVRGVPTAVCEDCGEEFVPGEFGVWLGDEVAKIAAGLQPVLAGEEALHDMVVHVGVDGEHLLKTGRISLPVPA